MVYTWHVRAIHRETAPFVKKGELEVRDRSKLERVEVRRTNAWNDDGGSGDYVLECELADLPPARSEKAADRRRNG
jgi:hypothetical protein